MRFNGKYKFHEKEENKEKKSSKSDDSKDGACFLRICCFFDDIVP
jgi:hypothetical protein